MSWEEFQGPGSPTNQQQGQQQQQEQQHQRQKRIRTCVGFATDVIRAMDVIEDVVCEHNSLPREISEKCKEVVRALKKNALDLIEFYNMLAKNSWDGRTWRRYGYRRERAWKRY